MFCQKCGAEINSDAVVCVKCGCAVPGSSVGKVQPEGKDWMVTLLLSIFLGSWGIDRFYLGYTGLGILKLCTLGGCGVWWLIDVILIATNKMVESDGKPLVKK